MYSDNNETANLGGYGTGLLETPTNEDSVDSLDDGLVVSDVSHFGSISAHSLDLDSIEDPPKAGFVDQTHQEGEGGGVDSSDETIEMEVEFSIVCNADIGEVGGGTMFPKAGPSATIYSTIRRLFSCCLILGWLGRLLVLSRSLRRSFI
jgi:hypothetical protein